MENIKYGLGRLFKPPYTLADFHMFGTIVWISLIFPTLYWWSNSVTWVLLISIYANIVAHAGASSAAKGAKKIEDIIVEGEKDDGN